MLNIHPEPFHCRRGPWCADAQPTYDNDVHTGWAGAALDQQDGLCTICRGKVLDALVHLPLDVAELTMMLARPLSQELRELIARPAPGSRLPIRDEIEALRNLIDHETNSWAWSVSNDLDGGWSRRDMHHSRLGWRVSVACMVLRVHLPVLLSLPVVEHRARSLTARRADGHDPDTTTRYGDDYWTNRDGVTGALTLLDLHQRAWRMAQRHTTWIPVLVPCLRPDCQQMALRRPPGKGHAVCGHCGARYAEDDLNVLTTALANSRPAA